MFSSARSAVVSAGLGRRAASSLAQKYSQAVYSAALSKSPQTLNKVHADLAAVASVKDTSTHAELFANPTLSSSDRMSRLEKLYATAESAGGKKEPLSDVTKNLFVVLAENGRLGETQGVIEGFNALVSTYKGELNVTVTSASPLPKETLARIESTLKQSQAAQQAKTLKVANKVNPSLLGGLVVDFGDKTVDLSVSSRVTKLNNLIQQSV